MGAPEIGFSPAMVAQGVVTQSPALVRLIGMQTRVGGGGPQQPQGTVLGLEKAQRTKRHQLARTDPECSLKGLLSVPRFLHGVPPVLGVLFPAREDPVIWADGADLKWEPQKLWVGQLPVLEPSLPECHAD